MTETELARKFISYFAEYDIYNEVPAAGIIDFVAVMGNVRTAVEVKTTFNWKVFEQAYKNRNYAHYSYIAVPYNKDGHFRERLCKDYGIGLLYWNQNPKCALYTTEAIYVKEAVAPNLNRKIVKIVLKDYMKESVAGSQSQRVTAFGNTVNLITHYLKFRAGGRCSIKRIIEVVDHHYGSNTSARQCIINMCQAGVIKDFEYDNGFIKLK
ncbi:hypothetical protein I2I11_04100 [Pontibacter sp. 172403-2]|uniref:hypothetical protein n=1 Tax=Pontibacter rufus TaxID=2791028 RepID=UPI0018AF9D56|nr:hypothetical protein [Pontibacter sp. 172403-2]MBF9252466.1 hypothetical protein [Pontibacter sp. 172403-2]